MKIQVKRSRHMTDEGYGQTQYDTENFCVTTYQSRNYKHAPTAAVFTCGTWVAMNITRGSAAHAIKRVKKTLK